MRYHTIYSHKQDRNIHLDLIRVTAMVFVIALHTSKDFGMPFFCDALIRSLFFMANGLFFILSGHFALRFNQKDFSRSSDYGTFYLRKFCSLIFPLIFYSLLLLIVFYMRMRDIPKPGVILTDTFWKLFSFTPNGHSWFIYLLIGFILASPFISNMLSSTSEAGLKVLFFMAIGFETLSIILFSYTIRSPFPISGWPFLSWLFYFICGFLIYRLSFFHRHKLWFILLGLVCLILTAVLVTTHEDGMEGIFGDSPIYLMGCIGLYLLIESVPVIKPLTLPLSFVARHSYAVYLIHTEVIVLVRRFVPVNNPFCWVAAILLTALISVAVAYPCDTFIIRPITKALTKSSFKVRTLFAGLLVLMLFVVPVILIKIN